MKILALMPAEWPAWLPDEARLYLAHVRSGHSIRDLARSGGVHASTVLRRIRADSRPLAGTRLVREWQGVQHVVTVAHIQPGHVHPGVDKVDDRGGRISRWPDRAHYFRSTHAEHPIQPSWSPAPLRCGRE